MSTSKPEIPAGTLDKWQRVIDLAATMAKVPAGLIMKTDAPEHAVLLKCTGPDNPYDVGLSTGFADNHQLAKSSMLDLQIFSATASPMTLCQG